MILTITMNPSIDISYPLDHLQIDDVNRVSQVSKVAGGKGLNVSKVINLLNHEVLATGITGGYFGQYIEDKLKKLELPYKFWHINQETRSCIAILHDGGKQTEILEAGPTLTEADGDQFLDHFKQLLKTSSLVTISGSLPAGLSADYYAKLIELTHQAGKKVLLDSSGKSLEAGLAAGPDLIKPNETELQQLLGQKIDLDDLDVLKAALSRPELANIEWVVVSLGARGAFAKHGQDFYEARIPKIKVVSPVGSGDSTLAGMAVAIDRGEKAEDVLRWGMTTGMLNTMEAKTGWIDPSQFDEYYKQVTVTKY